MSNPSPDWELLSSYAGLITLAVTSIYAGSHGSLVFAKHKRADGTVIEDEDDDEEIADRLSSTDAWLFPVIGSVLLLGLYLIVKYVGKEWINWLLQWYFTIAGVGSVGKSFVALARWTIGPERWKQFDKSRILITKGSQELAVVSLRTPSLLLIPLGALPSILYTYGSNTTRRSALLTDVLALSFAHNALSILKLDSFKTGCVLLSGLFCYDIWWVFGTEVMVKVATNLDVPIKLLWAKSLSFSSERGFTMLGLGDVVIPGMFVALALRYDYHRASQGSPVKSFTKPYFTAALLAYASGLGMTMFVMHVFRKAQPALLYLSPACVLSFLITAVLRGELADAWTWSDDPTEGAESGKAAHNGHVDSTAEVTDDEGFSVSHDTVTVDDLKLNGSVPLINSKEKS